MKHRNKTSEDLAWLMAHTGGFQGGQVLELHVQKRRVLDEGTGRDIVLGTIMTASIRYDRECQGYGGSVSVSRVAKLSMFGVTDFCIFEQEGTDISEIGVVQAEAADGHLRLWFDPCGELFVVCEEIELEEVSRPGAVFPFRAGTTEWTFQADEGTLPSVRWVLDRLDEAGFPCSWRESKSEGRQHPARRWEGQLLVAGCKEASRNAGLVVVAYGPLDGNGFGLSLRLMHPNEPLTERLLIVLADLIAKNFAGLCLAGNQVLEPNQWLGAQSPNRGLRSDA